MSVDKLVDSTQLDSDLTSVANAIRTKGGTSAQLAFPAGFVSAIGDIPSGGGGPARLVDYEEITMAATATSSDRLSVELTPITNFTVLVLIDTFPASPDGSDYIAIKYSASQYPSGNGQTIGDILRPNGTIGSDNTMCGYNSSTGVLKMGGGYGHFMAGTKYHVYLFEILEAS